MTVVTAISRSLNSPMTLLRHDVVRSGVVASMATVDVLTEVRQEGNRGRSLPMTTVVTADPAKNEGVVATNRAAHLHVGTDVTTHVTIDHAGTKIKTPETENRTSLHLGENGCRREVGEVAVVAGEVVEVVTRIHRSMEIINRMEVTKSRFVKKVFFSRRLFLL